MNHAHHTKPPESTRPIRGFSRRVVSCGFVDKCFLCPNLIRFDLVVSHADFEVENSTLSLLVRVISKLKFEL